MAHRVADKHLADERGIALPTALLVSTMLLAICTVAVGLATNAKILRVAKDRSTVARMAALSGLEEARGVLNRSKAGQIPDSGYVTLEDGVKVLDAKGEEIPGVRRWTYAGRLGLVTGQEGRAVTIVSRVSDGSVQDIERMDVLDESFARYEYFTNTESPSATWASAGNSETMNGPVHSNGQITVNATGSVIFKNEFTSAATSITGTADFRRGATWGKFIAMPSIAKLASLRGYAEQGHTAFGLDGAVTPPYVGPTWAGLVRARIEFVAVDLNADGDATDADEGFFRVYYGNDPAYVTASMPQGGVRNSINCGDRDASHGGLFRSMSEHTTDPHNFLAAFGSTTAFCALGGDPALNNGVFTPTGADGGSWVLYPGAPIPALAALGRADAAYLFPLSRALNPDFRGVIYVDGKVGVSGVVRGRVSVVSPLGIVLLDDLTTPPDPATCRDIIGLISPEAIVIANNTLNAAQWNGVGTPDSLNSKVFDETGAETMHAVILSLKTFINEDIQNVGAWANANTEPCNGSKASRGCFVHVGGLMTDFRSQMFATKSSGSLVYGHRRNQSYNNCAPTNPPPYFPTMGRFTRGGVATVEPVGFSVAAWFADRQAN